jgi:hypothetical protein
MAKEKESVIKPLYDVSVYSKYYDTSTIYKGATLKFLIESLKRLDGNTKNNAKVGTSVKGNSTNSKNTKPLPNMKPI